MIVEDRYMEKMSKIYSVAWTIMQPLFLISATSTQVERMNSLATHTNSPKRRSMKNKHFSDLILVGYNLNAIRQEMERAQVLARPDSSESSTSQDAPVSE